MGSYAAEVAQHSFNWGADRSGSESAYTLGTNNTDIAAEEVIGGNTYRYLRFELYQGQAKASINLEKTYKLQSNYESAGWVDVTTSTDYVQIHPTGDLTHGADTTNRTGTSGAAFLVNNNAVCDTSGTMGASLTWASSALGQTQILHSLVFISADLTHGDVIDFRIVESDSTLLFAYTVTDATVTISKTTPPTWVQKSFAWGDTGTESGHTIGTLNETLNTVTEETKVLRVEVEQSNASADRTTVMSPAFGLEKRVKPSGGSFGSWTELPYAETIIAMGTRTNQLAHGTSATQEKAAQSFQISGGAELSAVEFMVGRWNSPIDNIKVGIQADSSGDPSGTFLGFADKVGADLGPNYTLVLHQFVLDTPVTIVTGTTYWIVIERTGTLDVTDHYVIEYDSTNPISSGNAYQLISGTWTQYGAATNTDFMCALLGDGFDIGSSSWAHGDDATNRLTGTGASTYTFITDNNGCVEEETLANACTFPVSVQRHMELVVPINLAGFTAADTVEFRVVIDGVALDTITETPEIIWSVGGATTSLPPSLFRSRLLPLLVR